MPKTSPTLYHKGTYQFWQISIFEQMNFYNIKENDKIYIYSPSLHQDIYQKLIKCFTNYIISNIIPNILNEEDIDIVIDEIVNNKDFKKSDTEIETDESIEELNYPQDSDDRGIIIIDDINEKNMNDPRVQALFKQSRHNILSIFIISQENQRKRSELIEISTTYLN